MIGGTVHLRFTRGPLVFRFSFSRRASARAPAGRREDRVSNRVSATAILSGLLLGLALMVASPRSLSAATPSKAKVHGISLSGRVSKIDAAAMTLSVRDGSGHEVALAWTAATKITGGDPKVGDVVTLRYLDKDKKHIATTIHVGAPSAAKPTSPAPAASPSPAAPPGRAK